MKTKTPAKIVFDGDTLKALRMSKQMTQECLALEIGVQPQTIWNIEHNYFKDTRCGLVFQIIKVLDPETYELLSNKGYKGCVNSLFLFAYKLYKENNKRYK